MRGIQPAFIACILGLLFLVQAQRSPPAGKEPGVPLPGGKKAVDQSDSASKSESIRLSTTTSIRDSRSSSLASSAQRLSTDTNVAGESLSLTSSATFTPIGIRITNTPTPAVLSSTTSIVESSSSESVISSTGSMSKPATDNLSSQHRILVIVLSSVLGSIGLVLVVLVLFLICRYRKRRAFRRGVSPINDDEIESWRNRERKQPIPPTSRGTKHSDGGSIGLATSPNWTWTTSPTNVQSLPPAIIPRSTSFVAKAPNARAGLTDETVPGAAAFIPTVKRQSSRLSKAPPGHARTKSRRSSMSAKSMRSMNRGSFGNDEMKTKEEKLSTWYDAEDKSIGSQIFAATAGPSSSPGTSIYDGLNDVGGLSPRPKPRPWEKMSHSNEGIGRAIS